MSFNVGTAGQAQPAMPQVCSWCGANGSQVIFWHNFLHGGDAKGSGGTVFTLCDQCFYQVTGIAMTARQNSSNGQGIEAQQYARVD